MSLAERWQRQLDDLRAAGRYRELRLPVGHDFTSNDYLGFSKKPYADDLGLSQSGIASRLLRGQHPIWDDVESALARWHRAEAALMFTSGYVANEGLLSTVIEPGDWVASDQLNHGSIVDALRLTKADRFVYPHRDLDRLDDELRRVRRSSNRECFLVTESLFSMEGTLAPLEELAALAERHGANLIVDEAHATGCVGPTGAGLVESAGLRDWVLATVHTGGKALAVPGAYVAGSAKLREILVNRSRHQIFTTALPPRVGGWWRQAIERGRDDTERRRLAENVRRFRGRLESRVRAAGELYIVPIVVGADAAAVVLADELQSAGFDVRAVRPPTVPPGTSRLRISIHSDQDDSVLDELADRLTRRLA